MGWFSSSEEDHNKAYAEGKEAGEAAGPMDYMIHDIGTAIESNFGEPSSVEASYEAGWKDGWNGK